MWCLLKASCLDIQQTRLQLLISLREIVTGSVYTTSMIRSILSQLQWTKRLVTADAHDNPHGLRSTSSCALEIKRTGLLGSTDCRALQHSVSSTDVTHKRQSYVTTEQCHGRCSTWHNPKSLLNSAMADAPNDTILSHYWTVPWQMLHTTQS
jgi:hypothetical protein